jgi:hypothetical protein
MDWLKPKLVRALEVRQAEICAHIENVQAKCLTTAIEAVFVNAFESELKSARIKREVQLDVIRTKSYYEGRKTGRLDCYLPDLRTAFEYKAVRLPRRHSNCLSGARYDIGQLLADYLRLSRARNLEAGYVIAFVYGPLVSDAQSPGKLYRTFHNQMFVDFNVADGDSKIASRGIVRQAFRKLKWDTGWGTARAPTWAMAVKVGSLGAICIDCRS